MRYTLDGVNEFIEGTSKGYSLNIGRKSFELFVVYHHDKFYAYENHCPHTGVNLNWQPDQFLDITEQQIQCSTHGALFRISDGLCQWGPCLGQRLQPLDIDVQDDMLILIYKDSADS